MRAENLLGGLLGLGLFALWGRVALSLLPPGEPGFHRTGKLTATWAASHFLGLAIYHSLAVIASTFQLRLSWAWALFLPLGILAVRTLALPGEMVARGDPPERGSGLAARALLALVVLAVLVGPWLASDLPLELHSATRLDELGAWRAMAPWQVGLLGLVPHATLAALVAVLLFGLEGAGVGALQRRLAAALLLSTPVLWRPSVLFGDDLILLAFFGAGCSFAAVWWQRADPRTMVLAAICFAVPPAWALEALPLSAAGIAVLVAGTHPNARQPALLWCTGALLLAFPPWHLFGLLVPTTWLLTAGGSGDLLLDRQWTGLGALGSAALAVERFGLTWIAGAVAAPTGWLLGLRRAGAVRAFRRATVLLALAVALHLPMIVAQDVLRDGYLMSWTDALVRALPAAVLVFGLALGVRGERVA